MKKIILLNAILLNVVYCFSQGTAINSTGAKADSSAMLDVSSTTKGMLVPRMLKTEKLSIQNPADGLLVYQTDDTTGFWYFNSVKWVQAIGTLNNGSCDVQIVKTLISPVSIDNTTFLNDNELFFSMGANETWTFELYLIWSGTGGKGIQYKFAIPSGADGRYNATGYDCGSPSYIFKSVNGSLTSAAGGCSNYNLNGTVVNGANPGTFQLTFCQLVSYPASGSKIMPFSYLIARKVGCQ